MPKYDTIDSLFSLPMSKHASLTSFAAGSLLLAQLLSFNPVSAQTADLVKVDGNSAVYLIKGTTRHAFPLLNIYTSWYGLTFDSVQTITGAQLASYTLSKNVLFKPGSLIKIQTDPKVYHVASEDGALEWIPSEAEFAKRGFSFKDVKDVPDSLFSDYRFAVASDFATPQNPPTQTPTSPNTSIPEPEKPVITELAISNVVAESYADTDGSAQVRIAFATNLAASATIEILIPGSATTTATISEAKSFTKKMPVFAGSNYAYLITATAADGKIAYQKGSFTAYADIVQKPIAGLVPANSTIAQAKVLVGGFTLQNKSSAPRTATLFAIRFDSGSSVTSAVTKTLQIVRLKTDNTAGDVIAEKTIPSGTGITNSNSIQNLAMDEVLAPGETKKYGIYLSNLDTVNLELVSPTDTFAPFVDRIEFLGDTSVNLDKGALATFVYIK